MAHAESINENDYDGFLGIGKKAKAKKAVRVENRQAKKAVRLENKKSKVANRNSKAQSRLVLAEQGISTPSALGEVASGLGALVQNITGGGAPAPDPSPAAPPAPAAPEGTPPVLMTPKQPEPIKAIGSVVQGVKDAVSMVFGEGAENTGTYNTKPQRPPLATEPYYNEDDGTDTPEGNGVAKAQFEKAARKEKNKKYMPLIIGGIVVFVVVVLVVVLKKKK